MLKPISFHVKSPDLNRSYAYFAQRPPGSLRCLRPPGVSNHQERERWEHDAATLEIEKWGQMGTATSTSARASEASEVASVKYADDFEKSRGGTRTRDPGIMSAVL